MIYLTLINGKQYNWTATQKKPVEINVNDISTLEANSTDIDFILDKIKVPFCLPLSRWRGKMAVEIFEAI